MKSEQTDNVFFRFFFIELLIERTEINDKKILK